MDFIRACCISRVHSGLYTMMAEERKKGDRMSCCCSFNQPEMNILTQWTLLLWNPFLLTSASPLFPASQSFLLELFAGIFFTPSLWIRQCLSRLSLRIFFLSLWVISFSLSLKYYLRGQDSKILISSPELLLNSRPTYSNGFLTYIHRCLSNISNSTCPKLNS